MFKPEHSSEKQVSQNLKTELNFSRSPLGPKHPFIYKLTQLSLPLLVALGGFAYQATQKENTSEAFGTLYWENKTSSQPGRIAFASAKGIDGKFHVIGGDTGPNAYTTKHQAYNPDNDTWEDLPNMHTGRNLTAGAATVDGRILVYGGDVPGPDIGLGSGIVESYSISSSTWQTMTSMLEKSYGHSVSDNGNNKHLIFGGINNTQGYLSRVEEYNTVTGDSILLAPMQTARWQHTSATCDGTNFFVFSGINASGLLTQTEKYNRSTNTWTDVSQYPSPSRGLSATCLNGNIYVGGGDDSLTSLKLLYKYNTSLDSYEAVTDMPSAHDYFGMFTHLNNFLFVYGGWNSSFLVSNKIERGSLAAPTPTETSTATPIPPSATATNVPPTWAWTPVPPTSTFTSTPAQPTATKESPATSTVEPTSTSTAKPTQTATATIVAPTAERGTNTPTPIATSTPSTSRFARLFFPNVGNNEFHSTQAGW